MNIELYRRYLREYVEAAIQNSNGTNADIAAQLWQVKVSGLLVRNRTERERALNDARRAFDEHRHWPLDIVLSQLGIEKDDK